jgi:S-adenosylmethionine decarboxylase
MSTITYENSNSSGSHMICDIKNIENTELLNDIEKLKQMLDIICIRYEFNILQKIDHQFHPQGCTIIYMLSESHISIHTFPEKKYIAFDIYTCRNYSDHATYQDIYNYLIEILKAKKEEPIILDRSF